MRILLVEDDPTTSRSIELMLTHANLNVYATDMGEEGIDLAKLYDYDLILLDLNLPDMTGHDVLRQLRMSRIDTPILILSGDDDTEIEAARLRLRRRRLPDQALPPRGTGGADPRDHPPLEGSCAVGHQDRRASWSISMPRRSRSTACRCT